MTKLFNANNQFIEYMKISLVSDKNQIIANIKTIEKYLMGDSDNDFDIMAKHISHGRVFIAYKIDGDFHFAPSRFIGYANNTLERHKQNLDKHGTITTQQITRILGHSNIYSQELEDAYKTYCFWLGKQPSKNNRSYWCLEDEIPWESGNSHFFEGGRKLVTHMKIERNSKVVAEAKSIFKRNHNNELYCEICGFKSTLIRYESDVTEEELLAKVQELNADSDVDGFIVQLPLPAHISEQKVIETIDYRKDVDGFHPINVGRLSIGLPCYISATPNGIMELLRRYQIETKGKKCVILGRSNIVGKPMAMLMMQKACPGDATVTVCHSRSKDLVKECQEADILIAAMGQPNFVTADMVKEGAVVIDVGTTRVPDATKKSGFKLTGDVKFDEVAPKCSYITPVPGGVGPMTIVSLMKNTLLAGKKAIY